MNKFFVFLFSFILLLNFNFSFAAQDHLEVPDGTEFLDESEIEITEQNLSEDDVDDFDLDEDDLDDILNDIDPDILNEIEEEKPTFRQKMNALGALIKVKANNIKDHIKGHKKKYGVGGISFASLVLVGSILGIYVRKKKKGNEKTKDE